MKESVTRATKELRDHSQIVLRKIAEIADSTLPSIKAALEQAVLRKSEFRDKLVKYVEKNRYSLGGLTGLDLSDPTTLDINTTLISKIPFSVLISFLGTDVQKRVMTAIDGATYRSNGPIKRNAEGELHVELSTVRVAMLTTAEIFNDDIFVPTVEVGPQVAFNFNNRGMNNGQLQNNWLPNPENVSPIGSFAQVDSIQFGVLIDLDTAIKAYWLSQKSDIPARAVSPDGDNLDDQPAEGPQDKLNEFVNRGVASILLTFLASISRSIGLYTTALSELINPLTNVLDETFLEYADLDSPQYTLVDRKKTEPHWLRFNISKASALIDATIRGLNTQGPGSSDKRYYVFSEAMGSLIRGFFYHKYKIRNLQTIETEETTIPLIRVAEKIFEQIDRARDPLFFHELSDTVIKAIASPHLYFQNRDQTSGWTLAKKNGILLIQKTMVLIAYSSLMVHAESGLDRKYNQFNNFFGRKGGYKAMVKKLVYVLNRHLTDLFGSIKRENGEQLIPIFRWSKSENSREKELLEICSTILYIGDYEARNVYFDTIERMNLAFFNTLQVPFYPHYDDLNVSLRGVLDLMHGAQAMHDEEGHNDGPGNEPRGKLPLENYVRPFFGDKASGGSDATLSGKTLEQYNAQLDELIAKTKENESLDFCGGFSSPVTQMFADTTGLENEIEIKSAQVYEEGDPNGEASQEYIQNAQQAIERFDAWVLETFRKSISA